ncbi:hypothetical protein [Streptomyces buecherae]
MERTTARGAELDEPEGHLPSSWRRDEPSAANTRSLNGFLSGE